MCISPYFDHDAFMHHRMHVLDAPVCSGLKLGLGHSKRDFINCCWFMNWQVATFDVLLSRVINLHGLQLLRSFETGPDYVALLFCRSFDTNPSVMAWV